MKIVGVDNLNRETYADKLWLDNISEDTVSLDIAKRVCNKLNERLGDGEGTFYCLKPDNYRLSRGMEDFV